MGDLGIVGTRKKGPVLAQDEPRQQAVQGRALSFGERDGEEAARLIRELFGLQREHVVAALEKAHARNRDENGAAPSVLASLQLDPRPSEPR